MKKIVLLTLSLALLFSLTACGAKKPEAEATPSPEPTEEVTPEMTPEVPAVDPETPAVDPETPVGEPETPAANPDGTDKSLDDSGETATDEKNVTDKSLGGTIVTFNEGPAPEPTAEIKTREPGIAASGMTPSKKGTFTIIK